MTLMINARHLFYGISMLTDLQGWAEKSSISSSVCDELFHQLHHPGSGRGGPGLVLLFSSPFSTTFTGFPGRRWAASLAPSCNLTPKAWNLS